ncbi:MAG: Flagellar L-ring protein FlgH, partial [uncultured Microvirga sp.]
APSVVPFPPRPGACRAGRAFPLARRLQFGRPHRPDRQGSGPLGDRGSDLAAGLQARADADARPAARRLRLELTLAPGLEGLLQGPARGDGRRHYDGPGAGHRPRPARQLHQALALRRRRLWGREHVRARGGGHQNPAGRGQGRGTGQCRLELEERRRGLGAARRTASDQRRRRGDPGAAERQSGHRGQAGDPGQFRSPRVDRRRRRAARGHRGRQHDRLDQDRPGPHRLWRARPDHRRAAAPLRPAGDGHRAPIL